MPIWTVYPISLLSLDFEKVELPFRLQEKKAQVRLQIFTARIRRMGKVIFSQASVHSHLDGEGGGRVPHPLMGGTPFPGPGGYPLPRSRWGVGYPLPSSRQGGYPTWEGVPPAGGTPHQHSVYLLRGGRCASCVHAGGLSC